MTQATMTNSQQSAASEEHAQWALPAGLALRLDIGPGVRELQVTEGRLWLTREGTAAAPAEDVWLSPGDTVSLESGSEWVIEGWGRDGRGARFQLLVPPSACRTWAARLSASLQASSGRPSSGLPFSGGRRRRRFSFWPATVLG